ncbi:hypothetical protein IKP85_05145 [bacterium]|nr:hypothetical protein [bacterium]
MKKLFIILLFLSGLFIPAYTFELDTSIDDEIRKNYDSSKLEQDALPDLPKILKNDTNNVPKTNSNTNTTYKSNNVPKTNIDTDFSTGRERMSGKLSGINGNNSYTAIKIPKGTKFKVKSQTKLSDWNTSGARATFVSTEPVTKRYISVPVGTTFRGVIEDSHQPNFAGNGGLLKLKADSVVLSGNSHSIDAKVIRADNKKIFLNNIKGKRGYAKGVANQVSKGQRFYTKSRNVSSKMSSNPVGTILSPIPTIVGAVGYTANLIVSPVTALWSKGSHITLPAGTPYTLKFRQDLYIYK